MRDYKVLGYRKSKRKGKKYDAILKHKKTGKTVSVSFGSIGYETYRDITGLSLYKTHGDTKRRKAYKARHKGFIKDGYYSPGFFSQKKLW